jgi:glutathione S-transferase
MGEHCNGQSGVAAQRDHYAIGAGAVLFRMGARVGTLRARLNIKAPAISGHPDFERAFRVHANTGKQYIAFLPALWVATVLFHPLYWLPALLGALFLIGRVLYMRLYLSDPDSRLPGAFLSMIPILGLLVLIIIGIVQMWGSAF